MTKGQHNNQQLQQSRSSLGMNAIWMELVTQKNSVRCNIKSKKEYNAAAPIYATPPKSNGISLLQLHYTTLKEII